MAETKHRDPSHHECTAYCPICGSDLAFLDKECICKNKQCGWHCSGCKEDDDV